MKMCLKVRNSFVLAMGKYGVHYYLGNSALGSHTNISANIVLDLPLYEYRTTTHDPYYIVRSSW